MGLPWCLLRKCGNGVFVLQEREPLQNGDADHSLEAAWLVNVHQGYLPDWEGTKAVTAQVLNGTSKRAYD